MIFISFLIGGVAGALTMVIFAASAYEKGHKDGYNKRVREDYKFDLEG